MIYCDTTIAVCGLYLLTFYSAQENDPLLLIRIPYRFIFKQCTVMQIMSSTTAMNLHLEG